MSERVQADLQVRLRDRTPATGNLRFFEDPLEIAFGCRREPRRLLILRRGVTLDELLERIGAARFVLEYEWLAAHGQQPEPVGESSGSAAAAAFLWIALNKAAFA